MLHTKVELFLPNTSMLGTMCFLQNGPIALKSQTTEHLFKVAIVDTEFSSTDSCILEQYVLTNVFVFCLYLKFDNLQLWVFKNEIFNTCVSSTRVENLRSYCLKKLLLISGMSGKSETTRIQGQQCMPASLYPILTPHMSEN